MRFPILKYSIATILLLTQVFSVSLAQDVLPKPDSKDLVFDYASFLTTEQANELNNALENFAMETSNQIVFLSVKSLNDLQPYEYGERIISTWGVGQEGLNNGLVILLKPKTQESKGEVFISVGYGLEGAIPDATAKLIIENEMIPEFRNGNNYQGVVNAVNTLMALAKGEINSSEYQSQAKEESPLIIILVFFFIIFIIFMASAIKAKDYAKTNNLAFWTAFWLISNSSKSHGGSWGGFSGGGGFGGGGGGFGGFGGGMGGGGGAGGSW